MEPPGERGIDVIDGASANGPAGDERGGRRLAHSSGSAAEAVSVVRPGDQVFVGSACATPRSLVHALERRETPPPGTVLVHFLTDRVGVGEPPSTNHRHRVFYVGQDARALADSGQVDYVPLSIADVPELFRNQRIALDVAMVQGCAPRT